jgi:hypothetical protein
VFHCVVTFDRGAAMAVFGFGRRSTPNADKYIIPPQSWADPENAAFFARIGAKPNDPNNLRVTRDDVARMIDEGRKTIDARIHQLRAKALAEGHDNLHLRALWLLHDNIPICTKGIVEHLAKTGLPIILALRDKLRAAHDEVQRTQEFGRFQDIHDDTAVKVKKLAQMFGNGLIETYRDWLRSQTDARSTPR